MTVILIDGFDTYNGEGTNTGLQAKWTKAGLGVFNLVSGRFAGQAVSGVPAADDDLEPFARNEAADAEVLNRELVFAVGGEDVARHHAAARAERKSRDVATLVRTRVTVGYRSLVF